VSEMVVESMGNRNLLYFWYQTKSRESNNKDINRFHLAMHAIRRDNTYDLFIRPSTPVHTNEKVEDAERRMDRFVRDMMAAMIPYLKERAGGQGTVAFAGEKTIRKGQNALLRTGHFPRL